MHKILIQCWICLHVVLCSSKLDRRGGSRACLGRAVHVLSWCKTDRCLLTDLWHPAQPSDRHGPLFSSSPKMSNVESRLLMNILGLEKIVWKTEMDTLRCLEICCFLFLASRLLMLTEVGHKCDRTIKKYYNDNSKITFYFLFFPIDAGAPVYLYEFQHPPSFLKEKRPSFVRSDHADEIFSVFGYCFSGSHVKLSSKFCQRHYFSCHFSVHKEF